MKDRRTGGRCWGLAAAQVVGMRVEVREDGNVVLVEDADGGDVEAAEAALKEGLPGVQVLLKTKLIELREDGILEDQVLSGEEVELLIRQLSRSKGGGSYDGAVGGDAGGAGGAGRKSGRAGKRRTFRG